MIICPVCKTSTTTLFSAVLGGKFLSDRCNICLGLQRQAVPSSTTRADYRLRRDQEDHRKDIIQPYNGDTPNPEFIKAYPERASEYFTPEQLHNSERN